MSALDAFEPMVKAKKKLRCERWVFAQDRFSAVGNPSSFSAELDGFFVAHQIDREGPEGIQELFDRFARAMNLARVAAVEEATGRPLPEDPR